jgi:hypothetical protein
MMSAAAGVDVWNSHRLQGFPWGQPRSPCAATHNSARQAKWCCCSLARAARVALPTVVGGAEDALAGEIAFNHHLRVV